jgi:hypothetical protein
MKQNNRPNNLNEKILNANSIAKSPSMIDKNLHGDCFQLPEVDHRSVLFIPFQL